MALLISSAASATPRSSRAEGLRALVTMQQSSLSSSARSAAWTSSSFERSCGGISAVETRDSSSSRSPRRSARSWRYQEVEPDARSEVVAANAEGGGKQVDQLFVGRREHLERLSSEQGGSPASALLGERVPARCRLGYCSSLRFWVLG